MVGQRAAVDAPQMPAARIRAQRQMGDATISRSAPSRATRPRRRSRRWSGCRCRCWPDRVPPPRPSSAIVEGGDRIIAWRVIQGHPAVAPFDDALHRHVGMAAEPDRDPAAYRQRIDAGILDRVVLPAKVTCGSAHSACMTSTCSSERRPRLRKFSLRPTNSTGFQPTPPPDGTARRTARRARRPAWRRAPPDAGPGSAPGSRSRCCGCSRQGSRTAQTGRGKGRPTCCDRPIGAARDIDAEDMVGRRQILIADFLGRLRKFVDRGGSPPTAASIKGSATASFI